MLKLRFHHLACALATLGLSQLAMAKEVSDDELFFGELPTIASVSRLPQRQQDAPTSVTLIDRELIRASGIRDLNDVLMLVPGFQTFTHTTDPVRVTYHGLTDDDFSSRVQVLIDGRSLYSPLFRGGVNWNMLPVAIEDIERIEVVRGTNSAAYGTNAFQGVINIITVDPALIRGFSVSANQGNQGVRDQTLRAGGGLGEAGYFRFTYQQKRDTALSDRSPWHDSLSSRLFDLRADLELSDDDDLQVNLGQINAGMPMGTIGDPGWPLHDFTQSSSYLQTTWRHALSPDADLNLRYAYTQDRADDQFNGAYLLSPPALSPGDLIYKDGSFGGHSTRHELELEHVFRAQPNLRVAWGTGYREDTVQSELQYYGNQQHRRSVARTFGNAEWKPATWFTGNLGTSLDRDSLAGTSFSPRASAGFHVTPQDTFRIGYAKATRTPSIYDYRGDFRYEAYITRDGSTRIPPGALYQYGFYGNPNTPSEKLRSIDIGYLGEWRAWRMSLDIRAFREDIPNRLLIVSRPIGNLGLCDFRGCADSEADFLTPVQHIRTQGVEYQWRWQPLDGTRLLLNQTFTRIHADSLDQFVNDSSISSGARSASDLERDRQLAEMSAPRRATSLLWIQQLPFGFQFSAFGQKQSKMKWTLNSEAEGYSRLDLRLGYPFRLGDSHGEVALTAQSINGPHGEFRASGSDTDHIVTRRQWVSLRFDF